MKTASTRRASGKHRSGDLARHRRRLRAILPPDTNCANARRLRSAPDASKQAKGEADQPKQRGASEAFMISCKQRRPQKLPE